MSFTTGGLRTEMKVDRQRRVTGYASTFGNVDKGGDVVVPGAYRATLRDDMPQGRIKVRRNHERVIGKPVHAEEDSKGLLTVSYVAKTKLGDETLTLIEDGVIDRMSIGYFARQKAEATRAGRRVRELQEVELFEWSFLDVAPMNEEARITGVKTLLPADAERRALATAGLADLECLSLEMVDFMDRGLAQVKLLHLEQRANSLGLRMRLVEIEDRIERMARLVAVA